jgi:small subunit ribosomal protein S16
MLVIRMQRTGRKGFAQFRVVVQDSRRTPTSGKVVASLGHFNPHTKETTLDKEKAKHFLDHGAQPSDRVARLLKSEGLKLPSWVNLDKKAKSAVKNPDKLRKNRPPEAEKPTEAPASTDVADPPEEASAETKSDEGKGNESQGDVASEEAKLSSAEPVQNSEVPSSEEGAAEPVESATNDDEQETKDSDNKS